MKNPYAPTRVGIKNRAGYVHLRYEEVTHIHDDDPTMVEYIRADLLQPVGEVGIMPGSTGFTLAAFHIEDVPVGSIVYILKEPT